MNEVIRGLGFRINRETLAELKEGLFGTRAPCEGGTLRGRLYRLREWVSEHGPHMPRWGVDVHGWDKDGKREYLFSLYQIKGREVKQLKKLMRATDRPHEIEVFYWWA